MSMSEEQILWLAALLHDIGKFRERTADLMKKGLRRRESKGHRVE